MSKRWAGPGINVDSEARTEEPGPKPISAKARDLTVRKATKDDLDAITDLEKDSFPADEAASKEQIAYRMEQAGDLFYTVLGGGKIIGFCNATASTQDHLDHDSMDKHDAAGTLLCIHSVVVDPSWRRQGVATKLLRAYLEHMQHLGRFAHAALLTKQGVMPLYEGVGFSLVGQSDVVHGKDTWFELRYEFASKK